MINPEIEKLAPEINQVIREAKNILLHLHPNPDPDSAGSALGLAHLLRAMGKKVDVMRGDSPKPDFLDYLPGGSEVLDQNWFEIDQGHYDLFIVLDSGGIDRISALGEIKFPAAMRVINIDHHDSNLGFGQINLVLPAFSSTAEILYLLALACGWSIGRETAKCWLTGIYTDTGGFKFASTNATTLRSAAGLAELAPDFHQILFELENNNRPAEIIFRGLALNNVKTYLGDRVVVSTVSYQDFQSRGIAPNDGKSSGIPNLLKSVKGWEIAASLVELVPGEVKFSLRTRDANKYDLSKVAKSLGGGGHKAAAGATVKESLPRAIELFLEAVSQAYPELAK